MPLMSYKCNCVLRKEQYSIRVYFFFCITGKVCKYDICVLTVYYGQCRTVFRTEPYNITFMSKPCIMDIAVQNDIHAKVYITNRAVQYVTNVLTVYYVQSNAV